MGTLHLKHFKDININDPFFDSLKESYREFSAWFQKKSEETAYISYSDDGRIEGFLYLKIEEESVTDVSPVMPFGRRVKVGTFKIAPHGTKMGERFVKKMFDHAVARGAKEIYVTIFPAHAPLINLLNRYGFQKAGTKTTENGIEDVLLRKLHRITGNLLADYPLMNITGQTRCYLLGIHPEYHTRLFPDSKLNNEPPDIVQDVSHSNSIHKVYICGMQGVDALKTGDLLVIYRTSDQQGPARFRSVATSVCVVEEMKNRNHFSGVNEYKEYCRPYSVFSDNELATLHQQSIGKHVIRFTYNASFVKRITRGRLIDEVGVSQDAYWGFCPISHDQCTKILQMGGVHESLTVYQT